MKWSFVVSALVLAGCGPGLAKKDPIGQSWAKQADSARVERGGARAVAAAGDPHAMRAVLAPEVMFGGAWFPDAECRKQFARVGPIAPSAMDAFAKCLATLGWTASDRKTRSPDNLLLTYAPGLELEVMFSREDEPRIVWIGYVSRALATDNAPTVTQAALETHRIDPQPVPGEHALWIKLCIDEMGAITSVRPDMVTAPQAQEPLLAHVKQWRFQPFELAGTAAPVCAVVKLGADVEYFDRVPPVYAGDDMQGITVDPRTLGDPVEGTFFIAPDDQDKTRLARSTQNAVMGGARFCIDAEGRVTDARVTRTTGLPDYDARLTSGLKRVRVRPLGTRVCTNTEFIYSQKR